MSKITIQPLFEFSKIFKTLIKFNNTEKDNLFKSGRYSLEYGIRKLLESNKRIKKILLPSLICEEIIPAIKKFKLEIVYYEISSELEVNYKDIENKLKDSCSIILIINYFGFPAKWEVIDKIKNRHECLIIEDNAHSLFTYLNNRRLGEYGDISFNSYRKILPLLSGSELKSNMNNLEINYKVNFRFPIMNEFMYSIRSLNFNFFRKKISARKNIRDNYNLKNSIDVFSKLILFDNSFDEKNIITMRIKNYNFWKSYLSSSDLKFFQNLKISKDICPYVFPCYANSDKSINNWIEWGKKKNINIITWPDFPKSAIPFIKHDNLKHILCFPVNHQFDLAKIIG